MYIETLSPEDREDMLLQMRRAVFGAGYTVATISFRDRHWSENNACRHAALTFENIKAAFGAHAGMCLKRDMHGNPVIEIEKTYPAFAAIAKMKS